MASISNTSSSMESFAALFEESLARQEMRAGEVITAEVVSVDNDFVIVNAAFTGGRWPINGNHRRK